MLNKPAWAVLALGLAASLHAADFDKTHASFDRILRTHTRGDGFDYKGLKADPKPLIDYLDVLASVPRDEYERWSRADQEAFAINLYNASMINLVVDGYPVHSVRDLGFAFGVFRKPVMKAWGRTMSLSTLETDARRRFGDYRIHFALVCASRGCPPLRGEAYVGTRLNEQLEDQGRRFFAQPSKNRVDAPSRTLYVSLIFKWYKEDFAPAGGAIGTARRYLPKNQQALLRDDFSVRYTDYDWSLNEAARP